MTPGKIYVYRVAALNGAAASGRSNYYKAFIPSKPLPDYKVRQPYALLAEVPGGDVSLAWQVRSTTGVTGYQILRRDPDPDAKGAR